MSEIASIKCKHMWIVHFTLPTKTVEEKWMRRTPFIFIRQAIADYYYSINETLHIHIVFVSSSFCPFSYNELLFICCFFCKEKSTKMRALIVNVLFLCVFFFKFCFWFVGNILISHWTCRNAVAVDMYIRVHYTNVKKVCQIHN